MGAIKLLGVPTETTQTESRKPGKPGKPSEVSDVERSEIRARMSYRSDLGCRTRPSAPPEVTSFVLDNLVAYVRLHRGFRALSITPGSIIQQGSKNQPDYQVFGDFS